MSNKKGRYNKMVIYKIVNLVTNKCYIGSTVDFTYRKWCHIRDLKNNKHHSPILQNYWNKYGIESFAFIIIEEVKDRYDLINREQYWIDKLKPKFNCSPTASSPLGVKHTLKSRQNMSKAHKNKTMRQMGHRVGCKCFICLRKKGNQHPRYIRRIRRYCECGCGNVFICLENSQRRFINGHNKSQLGKKRNKETIEKQRQSLLKYYQTQRQQL